MDKNKYNVFIESDIISPKKKEILTFNWDNIENILTKREMLYDFPHERYRIVKFIWTESTNSGWYRLGKDKRKLFNYFES